MRYAHGLLRGSFRGAIQSRSFGITCEPRPQFNLSSLGPTRPAPQSGSQLLWRWIELLTIRRIAGVHFRPGLFQFKLERNQTEGKGSTANKNARVSRATRLRIDHRKPLSDFSRLQRFIVSDWGPGSWNAQVLWPAKVCEMEN